MRINGVEVSDEDLERFEGPSDEVMTARFKQFHRQQQDKFYEHGAGVNPDAQTTGRNVQSGASRYGGDPRLLRKHARLTAGTRIR